VKSQRKPAAGTLSGFPRDRYETPENMTQQKKMSLACVARAAAEKYTAELAKPEKGFPNG
jgi:hypothetical protein